MDYEWMNMHLFRGSYKRVKGVFGNTACEANGVPSAAEVALLEPFRASLPSEVFGPMAVPPRTDGNNSLRGNLIKMDYFRYVGRATHGTRRLDAEARARTYNERSPRFSGDQFVSVDTLFHLPEVHLYLLLIDWLESRGKSPDFLTVYQDVREMIDEAHRDGTLKSIITRNVGNFVRRDPDLPVLLDEFRRFAKTFVGSAPSFIARNGDARSKAPVDAGCANFFRRYARRLLHQPRVARAPQPNIVGKYNCAQHIVVSVHGIDAVQKRNCQTSLQSAGLIAIIHVGPGIKTVPRFWI